MMTIYGKPGCPQCTATVRKARQLGIEYQYVDVSVDLDAAARLELEGFRSLPVVKTADIAWFGFRPDLIERQH